MTTNPKPSPQSPEVFDFNNICDFFTAVCTAVQRLEKPAVQKNHQGDLSTNTWIGFEVGDLWFRMQHYALRATLKPMRPYVTTTADRDETARRISEDPKGMLLEFRNSGGWRQVDPGVAMFTTITAALGPKNNPMEERLHKMLEGDPKPN